MPIVGMLTRHLVLDHFHSEIDLIDLVVDCVSRATLVKILVAIIWSLLNRHSQWSFLQMERKFCKFGEPDELLKHELESV